MSNDTGYDGVTVLTADTMEDLAEAEAHLVRVATGAKMGLEQLPVAKHVRVYRYTTR